MGFGQWIVPLLAHIPAYPMEPAFVRWDIAGSHPSNESTPAARAAIPPIMKGCLNDF